eukprot:g231.t1
MYAHDLEYLGRSMAMVLKMPVALNPPYLPFDMKMPKINKTGAETSAAPVKAAGFLAGGVGGGGASAAAQEAVAGALSGLLLLARTKDDGVINREEDEKVGAGRVKIPPERGRRKYGNNRHDKRTSSHFL